MAGRHTALATIAAPPALAASREVEVLKDKEQKPCSRVGFPGTDLFNPDNTALEIIDEACSDLGSRLFLRIREEMGLAYFVGSSQMSGLARGMFGFYLGTSPEKVDEVKLALLDEISKLAENGLTAEEVARAREKSIGQQEIRNQSNQAFAFQAALKQSSTVWVTIFTRSNGGRLVNLRLNKCAPLLGNTLASRRLRRLSGQRRKVSASLIEGILPQRSQRDWRGPQRDFWESNFRFLVRIASIAGREAKEPRHPCR